VAAALVANDWDVAVVDDLSSGTRSNVPESAALHVLDIRDADGVTRVFEAFRPDVVCHHAAQASVAVSTREPLLDAQVNVLGSLNLLAASAACKVSRFVFARHRRRDLTAKCPRRARAGVDAARAASPYACSKLRRGLPRVIPPAARARPTPFCVTRTSTARARARTAKPRGRDLRAPPAPRRARLGVRARQTGDPGCVRDYVYIDDVVEWNLRAVRGAVAVPIVNVPGRGDDDARARGADEGQREQHLRDPLRPARAGDLERSCSSPSATRGRPSHWRSACVEPLEWFRSHMAD